MKCHQVRRHLLSYIERDPSLDLGEIADHLLICGSCAREEQQLQEALESLPKRPDREPPPHVKRRIQSNIAAPMAAPGGSAKRTWRLPATARRWVFSAMIAGLLGVLLGLGKAQRFLIPIPWLTLPSPRERIARTPAEALPSSPPADKRPPPVALEQPDSDPEPEGRRTVEEAVAESQRVAQAYGYSPREREKLAAICRAYHDRRLQGPVTSRSRRTYALRIATFACSRYTQAQEIAAVLDAAGLPTEIAPCRDGQVLVGVYVGPTSYEASQAIHRERPETRMIPYEEINQAWSRLGNYFFQSGCLPGEQPKGISFLSVARSKGAIKNPKGGNSPASAGASSILRGEDWPVSVDYVPTHIEWGEGCISSSENLYAGHLYTRYPLTHLVDGDSHTAWVFSGKGQCRDGWESRYALAFSPRKPMVIDSVWLMNGYNKSPELFLRNNRVVQIRLSINGKALKTASLSDKMGWHKVSLPRQAVKWLQIELTGIRKGRDDDVCISELAFYNQGEPLDMHLPQAVIFNAGRKGRGGDSPDVLISRKGEILAKGGLGSGGTVVWSPNRRYVAGVEEVDGNPQLWVAEVTEGRVIGRKSLPQREEWNLHWPDSQTVVAAFESGDQRCEEVWVLDPPD